MGITAEQIAEVNRTWGLAGGQFDKTGKALYATLFAEQPAYQDLFSKLKGKKREEYEEDAWFKFHYTRVVKQFSSLIGALETPEEMKTIMAGVVERHRNYKVDTLQHYKNLVQSIVTTLKAELGSEFTDSSAAAWGEVGALIVSAVESLM